MTFRTSLFLLLILFLTACNGQQESSTTTTAPPTERVPPAETTKTKDFDPYFEDAKKTYSKSGPTSITRNILQDRRGDIWLATWEGIIRYDGETFTNFTNQNYLRKFHVFSALEDRDGGLWFGTIGAGIYRYDGKNFTNVTQKDGLAHDKQGCFYQDRSGNIWIGTMGGISIYDGKSYRSLTTTDGLPDNDINSILEDQSGNIWIASRGALSIYDGTTFTVLQQDESPTIPTSTNAYAGAYFNVRRLIEDSKGNIWFGGKDGLWRYGISGYTQFSKDFHGYIFEDSEGNIWTTSDAAFGAGEWRISRYAADDLNGDEATPTTILQRRDMFFGISEDTDGNIWVGSLNGVGRYDGEAFDWFREE